SEAITLSESTAFFGQLSVSTWNRLRIVDLPRIGDIVPTHPRTLSARGRTDAVVPVVRKRVPGGYRALFRLPGRARRRQTDAPHRSRRRGRRGGGRRSHRDRRMAEDPGPGASPAI